MSRKAKRRRLWHARCHTECVSSFYRTGVAKKGPRFTRSDSLRAQREAYYRKIHVATGRPGRLQQAFIENVGPQRWPFSAEYIAAAKQSFIKAWRRGLVKR